MSGTTHITITYHGLTRSIRQWAQLLGLNYYTLLAFGCLAWLVRRASLGSTAAAVMAVAPQHTGKAIRGNIGHGKQCWAVATTGIPRLTQICRSWPDRVSSVARKLAFRLVGCWPLPGGRPDSWQN